jgi:hypothetical protein
MKSDKTPGLRIEPEIHHHKKETSAKAKEKPILE